MRKIAIMNEKGGVGKTTSTVNIAATMAKNMGKRVLVVDCDRQQNATQYLTGFVDQEFKTISDCILSDIPLKDIVINVPMKVRRNIESTKMWLVASDRRVSYLTLPSVYSLKEWLEPLEKKFDYCFFDMPPQFDGAGSMAMASVDDDDIDDCNLALSALVASDYVIVPSGATRFSITGFDDLIESINAIRKKRWNLDLCLLGVIFTNVSYQRSLEKYIAEENTANMKSAFKQHIKAATVVEQAEYFSIPVPYYEPNSPTSVEYIFLAKEIIKRIKEREGK